MSAEKQQEQQMASNNKEPTRVTIEYSKDTLKFLSEELTRLHEAVKNDPSATWAIDMIKDIKNAILSGQSVHSIPTKHS